MIRSAIAGLACLFVVAGFAGGSEGPEPILQPATYVSASGEFSLRVVSSNPHGAGPGDYKLTKAGEVVWSGQLPYTFWKAAVADDGQFGGYAYTSGWRSWGKGPSELVIALHAVDGSVRAEHRESREYSGFMHTPPYPMANGVIIHNSWSQLIIRLARAPNKSRAETWERFDLQTGERLKPQPVASQVTAIPDALWMLAATQVPGTPLMLVQWYTLDDEDIRNSRMGDAFVLVDGGVKVVWHHTRPGSLERAEEDDGDRREWSSRMGDGEGIASAERNKHFSIRSFKDAEQTTFEVGGNATDGWTVREVSREPFVDAANVKPNYEVVQLDHLGTIKLDVRPEEDKWPFSAITVGFDGRIYATDRTSGVITVMTPEGKQMRTLAPTAEFLKSSGSVDHLTVHPDGRVYASGFRHPQYLRFDDQGNFDSTVSPGVAGAISNEIFIAPDGGHFWHEAYDAIYRLTAEGEVELKLRRGISGRWFGNGAEVAVAPNGSIAVASSARSAPGLGPSGIHVFDAAGEPLAFVECPTRFNLATSGEWAVAPVHSDVYLAERDTGRVLKFTPALPEGAQDYLYSFISPAGELWLHQAGTLQIERFSLPQ